MGAAVLGILWQLQGGSDLSALLRLKKIFGRLQSPWMPKSSAGACSSHLMPTANVRATKPSRRSTIFTKGMPRNFRARPRRGAIWSCCAFPIRSIPNFLIGSRKTGQASISFSVPEGPAGHGERGRRAVAAAGPRSARVPICAAIISSRRSPVRRHPAGRRARSRTRSGLSANASSRPVCRSRPMTN